MSTELFDSAKSSEDKDFFVIENGDHNNTYIVGGPAYWTKLRSFMDKCLGETTSWVKKDAQI